jgi:hypothetical protein
MSPSLVDAMDVKAEGEGDDILADSLQAACKHGRIEIVRLLLERFGSSVGQRLVHADHNSSARDRDFMVPLNTHTHQLLWGHKCVSVSVFRAL